MENNERKINWFPGHMAKTRRLIAENGVLGELIAFNRLFGVRHKRPLRMRDALRNARRAAGVKNRGKVVRRHGLPDLCQLIRVHG